MGWNPPLPLEEPSLLRKVCLDLRTTGGLLSYVIQHLLCLENCQLNFFVQFWNYSFIYLFFAIIVIRLEYGLNGTALLNSLFSTGNSKDMYSVPELPEGGADRSKPKSHPQQKQQKQALDPTGAYLFGNDQGNLDLAMFP